MGPRALIPAIAAIAAIALTVALGNWQLRRAGEKEAAQRDRDLALSQAAVSIGIAPIVPDALEGARVMVRGVLLPDRSIFLDNRTRQGIAGFHVLTPMRLSETADSTAANTDRHVLVLRGWIARDVQDRNRLPPLQTPLGVVQIEGIAQAELAQPMLLGGEAGPGPDGARIWQRVSLPSYSAWSGLAMQPILVRQTSALDDGLERDWVQPGSSADKHRAYAVQWYAMAVAVAAFWAVATWLSRRRRATGTAT
jgi:cytochrome oxidase assembly protein ShyY1